MSATPPTPSFVTSADGVALAVYESAPPAAQGGRVPTIMAVHGYPDDHSVWDGVVEQLGGRFRMVTYDVRGAGASDRPGPTRAYRIERLVDDLAAVLDAVSPGEPVHLLAHDWGSIQSWAAVTDDRFADRLLSFTSISGPSLDMAAVWLRSGRRTRSEALTQLRRSYYIGLFQIPVLPELAARRGVIARLVAHSSSLGKPSDQDLHMPHTQDAVTGIKLYRANMLRFGRPGPRRTSIPVQVLAPERDAHVTVALQTGAPEPYADRLTTHVVPGNHWVVAQQPEMIAEYVERFAKAATP